MLKRNKHRELKKNSKYSNLVDSVAEENRETIPPLSKNQISAFMSDLGRKGGKIGGKRRLETMSAKTRTEVARKAANARWAKRSE